METNTNSLIRRNVVRRARVIHVLRPFVSGAALATVLFLASLYALGREVFVAQVFRNMPSVTDVLGISRFFVSALMNTHPVVQATCLLAAIALVWLAREFARSAVPSLAHA